MIDHQAGLVLQQERAHLAATDPIKSLEERIEIAAQWLGEFDNLLENLKEHDKFLATVLPQGEGEG